MDNDFVEEIGGNELVVLDAENSNLTSKSNENEKLDITEPEKSLKRYFYYQRGSDQAKCRLCNKMISRKYQSTKGMSTHLECTHKPFFKLYQKAKNQENMNIQEIEVKKQMKLTDYQTKKSIKIQLKKLIMIFYDTSV